MWCYTLAGRTAANAIQVPKEPYSVSSQSIDIDEAISITLAGKCGACRH